MRKIVKIICLMEILTCQTHAYFCQTTYHTIQDRKDIGSISLMQKVHQAGEPLITITQHKEMDLKLDEKADPFDQLIGILRFFADTTQQGVSEVSQCNQHQTISFESNQASVVNHSPELKGAEYRVANPDVSTLTVQQVVEVRRKFFGRRLNLRKYSDKGPTLVDLILENKRQDIFPAYVNEAGVLLDVATEHPAFFALFSFSPQWDVDWIEYVEENLRQLKGGEDAFRIYERLLIAGLRNDLYILPEARTLFDRFFQSRSTQDLKLQDIFRTLGKLGSRTSQQSRDLGLFLQSITSVLRRNSPLESMFFPNQVIGQWLREMEN